MIRLALLIMAFVPPIEASVSPDPIDPGIKIEDVTTTPGASPAPITNPGQPTPPEPTEHIPEPFPCRPEGPFPNTDQCIPPTEPTETEEPADQLTPARIEHEVRRIGLPPRHLTIQPPGGQTLVNLDTIFHTTAPALRRTVTVLNATIDLRAQPVAYTWNHGDGTTQTTDHPGRAYPHHTITHTYDQPGTVHPSLDIDYQVHYRINNGPWQTLTTTITAPGPTTPLRIRQARPVLEHSS